MNQDVTESSHDDDPRTERKGRLALALAAVIVLAVVSAGMPLMDAPWLLGDEHVFIVNNTDINGRGRTEPLLERWLGIFTSVHEDLYQPLPILSYAIEWRFSQGDPLVTRRNDVLLHAVNALLVWSVLYALLCRLGGQRGRPLLLVTWALALFWSLHPIHITTYVSDMCRTHLLSAMFALAAMRLHIQALGAPRRSWLWFTAAMIALLAAMLCKPVVGWFLVTIALEWAIVGPSVSVRKRAFYIRNTIAAAPCIFFAILTLVTSAQSGMMEDTSEAVFGDPLTRSLFALSLYARNLLVPLRLSTWYLSDPQTGWAAPQVWFGLALVVTSVVLLWRTARREATRGIALGIAWWWALLLPVIGVVAARIAAANDRYMYQPLIAALLIVGWLFVRRLPACGTSAGRARTAWFVGVSVASAAFMLLIDRAYCRVARSTIERAEQVVELYPGDPRGLEYLAQAFDFATTRLTPQAKDHDVDYFHESAVEEYVGAGKTAAQNPTFFPSTHDRAAFHRRLSFRLWQLGIGVPADRAQNAYAHSLAQARIASALEPTAPMSWLRLAQAHRALAQWNESLAAYQQLETLLPSDAPNFASMHTEFGTLLDTRFRRTDEARRHFELARQADPNFLPAAVSLAKLEIRSGSGQTGFDLVREVLAKAPYHVDARLVEGEYHLRSTHWNEALDSYLAILDLDPLNYDALRGFHEACANLGRWSDAIRGWDFAARNSPPGSQQELTFRSFQVWASACAGQTRALQAAEALMRVDPNNRFACLTRMLFALRENSLDQAVEWTRKAKLGQALPSANAHQRAIVTLRLLRRDSGLSSESEIIEALLQHESGRPDLARQLLTAFVDQHPQSLWAELAAELLSEPAEKP